MPDRKHRAEVRNLLTETDPATMKKVEWLKVHVSLLCQQFPGAFPSDERVLADSVDRLDRDITSAESAGENEKASALREEKRVFLLALDLLAEGSGQ